MIIPVVETGTYQKNICHLRTVIQLKIILIMIKSQIYEIFTKIDSYILTYELIQVKLLKW